MLKLKMLLSRMPPHLYHSVWLGGVIGAVATVRCVLQSVMISVGQDLKAILHHSVVSQEHSRLPCRLQQSSELVAIIRSEIAKT